MGAHRPRPAPGLAALVTLAGSEKKHIDAENAAHPATTPPDPAGTAATAETPKGGDPATTPAAASSETDDMKKCERRLIDAVLADAKPCGSRVTALAAASAEVPRQICLQLPVRRSHRPFGEITIGKSSFINSDLCTYSKPQRENLLSHAPVTLNITPLEAAGFAMFLAADPATPKRACPHLKPMKPAFCYERNAPADPPAITMIRDAMAARGSPPGVALAVFEDKESHLGRRVHHGSRSRQGGRGRPRPRAGRAAITQVVVGALATVK
jgi:hypothetical protein